MCKSSVSNGIGGAAKLSNEEREMEGLSSFSFHPSSTLFSIMVIAALLLLFYCLCGAARRNGFLRRVQVIDTPQNNIPAPVNNGPTPFVPRM